jgi:hypothetical protein
MPSEKRQSAPVFQKVERPMAKSAPMMRTAAGMPMTSVHTPVLANMVPLARMVENRDVGAAAEGLVDLRNLIARERDEDEREEGEEPGANFGFADAVLHAEPEEGGREEVLDT